MADDDSARNTCEFDRELEEFKGWGCRHTQSVILFFTLMMSYSIRAYMGVAMVAMTTDGRTISERHNNTGFFDNNYNTTVITSNMTIIVNSIVNKTKVEGLQTNGIFNALLLTPPYPKFNWSKQVQDGILCSFFWGYTMLQMPGSVLAYKFGTRKLLYGSLMINCVISLILPWAVYYGDWIGACICRALQGLTQACMLPAMHMFFGKWTRLDERALITAYAYGASALGPVFGMTLAGFLAASPLGWPGLFRFYGLMGIVMTIVIKYKLANSPAEHPTISEAELRFIQGNAEKEPEDVKRQKVPWGAILLSPGMLAINIAHIGQTWGHNILYIEIPSYMDKIMGVNIEANGMLTSLPFLFMWLTNFFFGWLSDLLIKRKILSVGTCRKLMTTLGFVPPGIFLIALGYTSKNIYVVESLLILICAFKVAAQVGFFVAHIDISPNYAGQMMGVSNFTSNLVGCLAPLASGFILTDVEDPKLWRQVFFATAGFYFVASIMYLILGTSKRAAWDNISVDTNSAEAENLMKAKPEDFAKSNSRY